MNKKPLYVVIPAIAIALIVGGAIVFKTFFPKTSPTATPTEYPAGIDDTTGKPSNFLGGLLGNDAPTPTPASSVDLSRELKDTVGDGGAAELESLESDANSL